MLFSVFLRIRSRLPLKLHTEGEVGEPSRQAYLG